MRLGPDGPLDRSDAVPGEGLVRRGVEERGIHSPRLLLSGLGGTCELGTVRTCRPNYNLAVRLVLALIP